MAEENPRWDENSRGDESVGSPAHHCSASGGPDDLHHLQQHQVRDLTPGHFQWGPREEEREDNLPLLRLRDLRREETAGGREGLQDDPPGTDTDSDRGLLRSDHTHFTLHSDFLTCFLLHKLFFPGVHLLL